MHTGAGKEERMLWLKRESIFPQCMSFFCLMFLPWQGFFSISQQRGSSPTSLHALLAPSVCLSFDVSHAI